MSESERFEAQGRAHAALKQARSNAATLRAVLKQHALDLKETAHAVHAIVSGGGRNANAHLSLGVEQAMARLSTANIPGLIEEMYAEEQRAAELQQQVDQF